MGCGASFVKYVLFFFNLLFALIGLAMIGIGVAVLMNWGLMKDLLDGNLNVAPWVFIVIGVIVFVIAFFGCCGSIKESHCMIVSYAIFLLVIIIAQVALAVLLFAYGDNIRDALSKTVTKIYERRTIDTAAAHTFQQIEQQLECCGKSGPGDYGFTQQVNLPASCCTGGHGIIGQQLGNMCTFADANKDGCVQKAATLYEKWNKTIAGVAIGVACIEVVGALFALCLANSIRNMDRRYA